MKPNIEHVLTYIATQFDLNAQQLITFCYEDTVGGFDASQGTWPTGSLWSVEGRILYALTRALRPEVVVEVGTWHGCSATHFLSALHANDQGVLHCVDDGREGYAIGDMIPNDLRYRMNPVSMDALKYLPAFKDHSINILYEDGDHSTALTRRVWELGLRKVKPGGLIISHDAMHFIVGEDVRRGILESAAKGVLFTHVAPSDCGLAILRLPELVEETPKKRSRK